MPLCILKVVFSLELKLSIPAFVLGMVLSLNFSKVHSQGEWRMSDKYAERSRGRIKCFLP